MMTVVPIELSEANAFIAAKLAQQEAVINEIEVGTPDA